MLLLSDENRAACFERERYPRTSACALTRPRVEFAWRSTSRALRHQPCPRNSATTRASARGGGRGGVGGDSKTPVMMGNIREQMGLVKGVKQIDQQEHFGLIS